jgi:hypothetical protein
MNSLKSWIDKNPDYLLILSSDHGCDDITKYYYIIKLKVDMFYMDIPPMEIMDIFFYTIQNYHQVL